MKLRLFIIQFKKIRYKKVWYELTVLFNEKAYAFIKFMLLFRHQ